MQRDSFVYNGTKQRPNTAELAKKQGVDKKSDLKTDSNAKCGGNGWNHAPLALGAGSWLVTVKDAQGKNFASWSVLSLHDDGTMTANDSGQLVQPKSYADFTSPIGTWCLLNRCGKWKATTIHFTSEAAPSETGVTGRISYCGEFEACDCDDYNRVSGVLTIDYFEKATDALCCDVAPIFSIGPCPFEGEKIPCAACMD